MVVAWPEQGRKDPERQEGPVMKAMNEAAQVIVKSLGHENADMVRPDFIYNRYDLWDGGVSYQVFYVRGARKLRSGSLRRTQVRDRDMAVRDTRGITQGTNRSYLQGTQRDQTGELYSRVYSSRAKHED